MPLGRRKPYTDRGIKRVPCARCGKPSRHQWAVCSLGNRWLGVCLDCDILLNERTLKFFNVPKRDELIDAYITKATRSHD